MLKTPLLLAFVLYFGAACGQKSKDNDSKKDDGIVETCENGIFCIVATKGNAAVDFTLNAYDTTEATVTLTVNATNMQASAALPYTAVAKGAGTNALFQLNVQDPSSGYSYSFTYDWGYGVNTAQHDATTVYRLPYADGETFVLVQGYNSTFTHNGEEQYALDFAMPEGTPVHAARGGKVLSVTNNFAVGGTDPTLKGKANGVKISHDDGTIGEYLHFRKDGVSVTSGQIVSAGDLLGYSGNTGFTSGPHLHFEVHRRIDGAHRETLATVFRTETSDQASLVEGQTYTAIP